MNGVNHSEILMAQNILSIVERFEGIMYRCEARPPYRLVYISTGVDRILGFPANDFLEGKRDFSAMMLADDRVRIGGELDRAIADGRSWNCDFRLVGVDGIPIWVNEVGAAVFDEAGDAAYLEGVATVIEAKKRAEADKEVVIEAAALASSEIVGATDSIFAMLRKLKNLAINSRIEAARAGPEGLGFAVIAQEIASLASEASDLASGIALSIETMQGAFDAVGLNLDEITRDEIGG